MFNSSMQVSSLRKLLISYSISNNRQTIFASASIPQHRHFLRDCIQHKWTKADVVYIHVNPVEPMPSCLDHRFVVKEFGTLKLVLFFCHYSPFFLCCSFIIYSSYSDPSYIVDEIF
ncbi:hypothetical protein U1Q18_024076 [Sarracenia purpurea var. burkii]